VAEALLMILVLEPSSWEFFVFLATDQPTEASYWIEIEMHDLLEG
jgi:hypothetical protein